MTVDPTTAINKGIKFSKSKFSKFRKISFFKKNAQVQNDDFQSVIAESTIPLNFKQNLKEQRFSVAEKQLIHREERLFAVKQDGLGSNKSLVEEEEDDEETLKKDFEDLLNKVLATVENSFKVQTEEEKEALKQAILVIQEEEEQDRRWEDVAEQERPPWRPRCCRRTHDSLLQEMVKKRMEEAKLDSKVNITSSIQKDITGKAKRLKEDLLHLAKHVKSCYPEENVCQMYANLYHQAFSAKLREIADYGLSDDDCSHLLQWVNIEYPSILRHEELTGVIKYEHLEALLPENMLEPLEKQFLIQKENDLQKWWTKILNKEKYDPELRDGCYFSNLAIDAIECIHGAHTSAQEVTGSCKKSQRITHQWKEFFIKYKEYLENITNDNQVNTDAVLKANLHCIRQFREYIIKNQEVFPADVKAECLSLLTKIREHCHGYFTRTIHIDLKKKYSKLGTRDWLKQNENVCADLLEGVATHIQKLTNLDKTCLKELISQLHKEVLAKYVGKMMKKKLKLKDDKKQEQAAKALKNNNQKLHTLFTEAGSNLDDLEEILRQLAELLTTKDTQCIELQLVTLSQSYPDFSEAHVSAWLYLKASLSSSELKNIKKTFSEIQRSDIADMTADHQDQDPLYLTRDFFSKVLVK